jgi:hypothetical protein
VQASAEKGHDHLAAAFLTEGTTALADHMPRMASPPANVLPPHTTSGMSVRFACAVIAYTYGPGRGVRASGALTWME